MILLVQLSTVTLEDLLLLHMLTHCVLTACSSVSLPFDYKQKRYKSFAELVN